MNEEQVAENTQATPTEAATTSPAQEPDVKVEEEATAQPDRTFTRDEVTSILRGRLERANKSLYDKYGVKNAEEFNALFEKAKSYDTLKNERDDFAQKIAFLENNIEPSRYEDIKTYFKGKGMVFDGEVLKTLLDTHPEWVKKIENNINTTPKTTISKLGSEISTKPNVTDKERAEKLFGMKL